MVDAAEIVETGTKHRPPVTRAATAVSDTVAAIEPYGRAARASYAAFSRSTNHGAAQSPAFVAAWGDEPGSDLALLSIKRDRKTVFALVLEIVRVGRLRMARYPGGRHANGNFPPFAGDLPDNLLDLLAPTLRDTRPDIDIVLLERNERVLGGRASPLAAAGRSPTSPNVALAVDLAGGFDALLERTSGKRKRKKHRSQIRKFEAAGGYRRYAAQTPDEVATLLSAFYEMKSERFRQMGITDVFAPEEVRNAFARLFTGALALETPEFILHGLDVGGVLRAVTGSSLSGDRITCEFSAFRDDELSAASPGDFLFFENIREACDDGFAIYDFGVGDERYKRLWCNLETRHFDLHLPLTPKGRLFSAASRAMGAAKRFIKENRLVWSVVKRLRRASAVKHSADDES